MGGPQLFYPFLNGYNDIQFKQLANKLATNILAI